MAQRTHSHTEVASWQLLHILKINTQRVTMAMAVVTVCVCVILTDHHMIYTKWPLRLKRRHKHKTQGTKLKMSTTNERLWWGWWCGGGGSGADSNDANDNSRLFVDTTDQLLRLHILQTTTHGYMAVAFYAKQSCTRHGLWAFCCV